MSVLIVSFFSPLLPFEATLSESCLVTLTGQAQEQTRTSAGMLEESRDRETTSLVPVPRVGQSGRSGDWMAHKVPGSWQVGGGVDCLARRREKEWERVGFQKWSLKE